MIVRPAQPGDLRAMVEFGRTMHARSPKARYCFDEVGALALGAKCTSSDKACAFLAERDGEIVALLLGWIQRWPYLDGLFATDVLFMSAYPGAGRKCLRAFVAWARSVKADEVFVTVGFGGKSAAKEGLYEREGFTRMGSRFAMDLRE